MNERIRFTRFQDTSRASEQFEDEDEDVGTRFVDEDGQEETGTTVYSGRKWILKFNEDG